MSDPETFDALFDAWRSTVTGHRVRNGDGSEPKSTKELALRRPWLAPVEMLHRVRAKRQNPGINPGERTL
jgi:hypothetical protein